MVELVDALDSKSSSARSVGSIPTARTILANRKLRFQFAREISDFVAGKHSELSSSCKPETDAELIDLGFGRGQLHL